MRSLTFAGVALLGLTATFGLSATGALAQAPYGMDTATGARPGHEPGVGTSLPMSDRASNIVPGDTRSIVAPTLPSPPVGPDAGARDYLAAARTALAAGRTGEAQQSLEMAETRALDRSVAPSQADMPSRSRFIAQIGEARRALGSGDRAQAMAMIDQALANQDQVNSGMVH